MTHSSNQAKHYSTNWDGVGSGMMTLTLTVDDDGKVRWPVEWSEVEHHDADCQHYHLPAKLITRLPPIRPNHFPWSKNESMS